MPFVYGREGGRNIRTGKKEPRGRKADEFKKVISLIKMIDFRASAAWE